jgi:hypothetical protein
MMVKPEPFPPRRFARRVYPVASAPRYERTGAVIAHHEAGHAVFMRAVGIPLSSVEVRPDGGGEVSFDRAAIDVARAAPVAASNVATEEYVSLTIAGMYCAGRQAELLFLGLPLLGMLLFDDPDHDHARLALREGFGSVTPLGYSQHLARAVLSQRWSAVELLAAELLRVGRLEF